MFPGNGGVAKNSRKRKMKEVAAETEEPHQINPFFNLYGHHHFTASPSSPPPLDAVNGRQPRVQQILNNAALFRPFSFTSLLTADDENDRNSLAPDVKDQTEQIDQIISFHSENLRQAMREMLGKHHRSLQCAAEERAAKKLKEKELELQGKLARTAELERMVEHYKEEADRLLTRVRHLEQATTSLRAGLREATAARRYAETAQEDAESSFEDPDRVEPVRLDCKTCNRRLATVMMWPCRHVCVCTQCESIIRVCPVCLSVKATSVEVYLPVN